jgi:hypothetical protein
VTGWLEALSPFPGPDQFGVVQRGLLDDETGGAGRQPTCDERKRLDGKESLLRTVVSVKVRRHVIVEEHADDDPVEPAQLRPLLLGDRGARKQFFGFLTRQFEVHAVGAKLNVVAPGDTSVG